MSDLVEQIYYTKHHQLPEAKHFSVRAVEKPDSQSGAPTYDLEITLSPDRPSLKIGLVINGPIWSPDAYADTVAALAKDVGLTPTKQNERDTARLLAALVDGGTTTIEEENQKLSKALERNFDNALLHEEAAVLLGVFTLREHSGKFFEIRSPLCRITAQLAIAQYLSEGAPMGINGRVADAMLSSLMNNQAAALNKLDGLEKTDPAVNTWIKALRAHNTSDYRPFAESKGLSSIERIEWFRAFVRSVDTDVAWGKLSDAEKLTPDFARIANEESFSVETGHQLLRVSLPLELREIAAVYKMSSGQDITPKELAGKLNALPGRCLATDGNRGARVAVIDWGLWAMFFQRQVCHAVQQNFNFLEHKWGVHDEAKKFSAECNQMFGTLRLFPFVRRFNCTDVASYHSAVDDGMRVTVATPHLTPAECWNYLCYRVDFAELYQPNPNPHINEWHKHNPPPGTAYDPLPRFDHPSLVRRPDASTRIAAMHALAPYDHDISFNLIRTEYRKQPTYEQAQEVYKPVLPYATYAMATVAETAQNQPDRYEALMAKAAEPDPARYYTLGDYFRERKMEDKAAKYFEKGSTLCPDSVSASYRASWLVRYYLKKGETQKARSVADAAGEVYSAVGLRAKAEFLEATGKHAEALDWYSKIDERYDDPGPVIGFCMRCGAKTGDRRFEPELQKRSSIVFPKGVEKASLKDFQSPPSDGVFIAEENDLVRKAGLKRGDVIVAIYGVRVHSFKQYTCAREFNLDPELDLIVWQGDGYHEVKASPLNHRFGVDFTDYPRR